MVRKRFISVASAFLWHPDRFPLPRALSPLQTLSFSCMSKVAASALSQSRNRPMQSTCLAAIAPGVSMAAGGKSHSSIPASEITLLSQDEAIAVDEGLMATPGFSVDQLMELAGLSVACAVADVFPTSGRVLIVAGPGNNGGDGLVAARHLRQFGYAPTVVYPKRTNKPLYDNLVKQCEWHEIPVLDDLPDAPLSSSFDVIIDAIFGFSFRGMPRPPFDAILARVAAASAAAAAARMASSGMTATTTAAAATRSSGGGGAGGGGFGSEALCTPPPSPAGSSALAEGAVPVVAVDVPSGWDVEGGDVARSGYMPAALVSLTTPKRSARHFVGRHYLGGRFVPPWLKQKYGLKLPEYPGDKQCVELEGWAEFAAASSHTTTAAAATGAAAAGPPFAAAAAKAALEDVFVGDAGVSAVAVWVTAGSRDAAVALARLLVEKELAACANLMPVESVYKWQGKVNVDSEVLLMIKTRAELLPRLTDVVAANHAYEIPETIAAQIVGGNRHYLDWIKQSTALADLGGASGGSTI